MNTRSQHKKSTEAQRRAAYARAVIAALELLGGLDEDSLLRAADRVYQAWEKAGEL